MIYRNFLIFKLNIFSKNWIMKKMKYAQILVLYSSSKYYIIKKKFNFEKIFSEISQPLIFNQKKSHKDFKQ